MGICVVRLTINFKIKYNTSLAYNIYTVLCTVNLIEMTLKELKQRVDTYYEMNEQYHDLEVCIPNNKNCLGGTSVTKVKYANKGIDWDNGKFILSPEVPMIEKPNGA